MKEIFKAYDIRGIYPTDLDEKLAEKIGKAYVLFLEETYPDKKNFTVIVSRDMRLSSPALADSVIKGITSMGCDVVDIELSSTPTFYFAVGYLGVDGGIQVSASHNPKEWNGMKVVLEKGYPVGLANGLDRIHDIVSADDFKDAQKKGTVTKKDGLLDELVKYSQQFYDFSAIKKFKIVADVANAMSSPDLDALFKAVPSELVRMNFELDGTFPVHQADPFQEKNVADLKKRVVEEKADIGIATDGDGDRYFFIDNTGWFIEPAIIRGIIAEFVLKKHPGANIGYDIRPGMITRDLIIKNKGKPFVTKVGHSLIKIDTIKNNAPFSGESSGHFFFKSDYGTYELPLITTLIILKIMSDMNQPLSEIVKPLRRYHHSGEINSTVKDPKAIMEELEEKYAPGAENVSKLDGILIEHKDYWFNVRGSNTEPLLRLNLEARTREKMEEMRDKVLAVIRG